MQKNLLEVHPKADLRVYAVWFNMYPGDARSEWPKGLLSDSRVIQFWDEGKSLGRFYERHLQQTGIVWDTYVLYDPQATWEEKPSPPAGWGRPVIVTRHKLEQELQPYLQPRSEAR